MTGVRSPWGLRGMVMHHFPWTYEYLLWGIRWPHVLKMMSDVPAYKKKTKGTEDKKKAFDAFNDALYK